MTGPTINSSLLPYLPSSYQDPQGNLNVSAQVATTVATDIENDANALPPAQQKLFLDLVSDDSAELAPTGGNPPADLASTLTRLQKAATSMELASFLSEGVDPAALAKAIILLANAENTDALTNQLTDISQATANLMAQAADDINSANALSSGAVLALVLGCLSAAASIGGGLVSIGGATKALGKIDELTKSDDDVDDDDDDDDDDGSEDVNNNNTTDESNTDKTNPLKKLFNKIKSKLSKDDKDDDSAKLPRKQLTPQNMKEIELYMDRIQGISAILNAVSTVMNAVGNYESTSSQADSKIDEAEGAKAAAESQQDQALAAIAQTLQQSLTTFTNSMMQYVSQIESAVAEQMQAITRG